MMEITYLKKLARFRPFPLPFGYTHNLRQMAAEEIDARRTYIRRRLAGYESKLPFLRFDNDTIDKMRVVESDDWLLVDVWDEKLKTTYEYAIERASWDRSEDK